MGDDGGVVSEVVVEKHVEERLQPGQAAQRKDGSRAPGGRVPTSERTAGCGRAILRMPCARRCR